MRFSLKIALALLTVICVALGMYREHGAFGLWFLAPHLLLIGVLVWFWRRKWKRAGWISAAIYLAAWAITWIIGIPELEADVSESVTSNRWSYAHDFGPFRRADYDSFMDRTKPPIPAPWYFVGNGSSPCPFVASVEYGHSVGGAGGGGRIYAVWLAGWRPVAYQFLWCS